MKKNFLSTQYAGSLTPQLEGARHTIPHSNRTSTPTQKLKEEKGGARE